MRLFTLIVLTTLLLAGCSGSGGESGSSGSAKSFGLEDSSEIRGTLLAIMLVLQEYIHFGDPVTQQKLQMLPLKKQTHMEELMLS